MHPRTTKEEVSRFLARLPQGQRGVVRDLRRETTPATAETVLWKSLSYHRPNLGGRIKGAVCLITPKSDGIHLDFIHGVAIPDPAHLLRGEAKSKRFVLVRGVGDVDRANLKGLIAAAAEYDPCHPSVP